MLNGRRSSHRWWVAFASIAGAMLATAGASARETVGKCDWAVARGIICGGSLTHASDGPALDNSRSVTPLRADAPACLGPCDDGTSQHPRGAELWDDFAADDDGTDLPLAAWLWDAGHCSIAVQAESALARVETGSATSRSRLHLRC